MVISQSSANLYAACQRKYWHKTQKCRYDPDWKKSKALCFGAAFAECQETMLADLESMPQSFVVGRVMGIGTRHGLELDQAAKLYACLRAYFAEIPQTDIVERKEVTIEHPLLSGRVDKLILRDGKRYIGEDKTASEISPALETLLETDPQCCAYAASSAQFGAVEGIIYRVTRKPKEQRRKAESWLDFANRCTCEFRELVLPFTHFRVEEAMQRLTAIDAEASNKKVLDDYHQNFKNCIMFGSACEFYSQCHGKTYSASKRDW